MLFLAVRERPLSAIAAGCAVAVVVFEVVQIMNGELYLRVLDSPDGTTLIMVCCLMVAALLALRERSDLQALAFAWVAALSCVFLYEAIYKWSFFLAPFAGTMPPPEIRGFVLHLAVAATVLTGFAQHHFSWTGRTWFWLSVFCGLWVVWLLVGFPQLDGRVVFPQVLSWELDRDQVYLINRATKLALFIAYFSFLPSAHSALGRKPVATWRPAQ